jgi:hypothetical protein
MADTILSGKLTVYYLDENRRKQIRWTGTTAKTDVQKMIDVYDATEDLMTIATQMNDGLIFSAETPGEYTVGKIDAGQIEPWFIDLKTMEHIIGDYTNFTGCALKTSGWARVQDSNAGIVVVAVTAATNNIVTGDIGQDITHADLDAGTLLDVVITGGTTDYLWIRPDSSAAANNWDSVSGTITEQGSSKTAVQSAAAVTGEMVWGNVYTQGALVNDAHVYIFQNGTKVTISDDTDNDWWPDGHIDRAVPIKDWTTAAFPTVDEGYLTVKANQYGSKHTYAVIRMNTTTGGNVSAGLSSGDDTTNTTGYASITYTNSAGNWNVGDEILGGTSGARGIITQIDGTNPTITVHYFLVGDPLVNFQTAVETANNQDDTGTGSKNGSAPANQGPALTTWFDGSALPVYSFTSTPTDINDDGTTEEYGIAIDCNQASLAQMHEYNKYTQRRGSTLDHDGLDGEEWIGLDLAINYSAFTATIAEGDTATGATSGATAIVVSFPGGTNDWMLLRNTRGTFTDSEVINFTSGGNMSAAQVLTVDTIVPVAESSFGTLAGTNWFGSRGVVLTDYKTTEENLFSVIAADGVPYQRPTSITMSILNALQYDYITCWRLTGVGGSINKTEYTATGGEAIGAATLDTDSTIAADVPGKTTGGTCVLVDVTDNNQEYVLRYSSYNATTGLITLANTASTSNGASTSTTVIHDTGATFTTTAKVGDLLYNTQGGGAGRGYAYVKSVDSDTQLTLDRAITGQVQNDSYELNCVPVVPTASDKVFFAIVWEFRESDGTASASMQYVADIYSRVIARNTSAAAIKIKGYTADTTIGTGGGSASVTRIPNTVYGS